MVCGASFDTPEENRAFKEKFGYPFSMLCDTGRELGRAYGACGAEEADAEYAQRITVVIGPEGKVSRVYEKVSPKTHPDEVLADLRARTG